MKPTTPFAAFDSSVGTPAVSSNGLLDQAYDEYCLLDEAGLRIGSEEFLGRYPTIRSSLARLIEIHRGFEDEALRETAVVWPMAGDEFHGFHLLRHLGDGASSRVFLAKELALGGRHVAVKITRQGDAEAFTLGRVKHPNVIPIHSRISVPGQDLSIICMEYLGSATLCSLLDRVLASPKPPADASIIAESARDSFVEVSPAESNSLPEKAKSYEAGVRRFFADVCGALEYLHGRKILHRDLKPSNILMRPDGSPVLLDFNLALDLQGPAGRFGGTYPYMPPEQLRAMSGANDAPASAVDERSDLFAVGVLLWETLTGKLPFGPMPKGLSSAEAIHELLTRQHAGFQAPMLGGWSVSPDLVAIVRRCLAPNPAQRPASAAELRRLLVPPEKPKRRGAWLLVATAATIAGVWIAAATNVVTPSSQISAETHYQKGVAALEVGDLRTAYDEFSHVVNVMNDDPRGWRARALASVKDETHDKERIKKALNDALHANSLVDVANKDYAYTGYLKQLQGGNFDLAESQYQQALENNQSPIAVNNNLSALYFNKPAKLDDAIALADRALAAAPKSQAALINRGLARYKRAITSMKPDISDELKKDLRSKSVADLEEALEVGPESVELHRHIASAIVFPNPIDGDYLSHLRKAVELGFDPKDLYQDVTFKAVRNDPGFRELLERQPGNASQLKMRRLIPPRTEPPEWKTP